MNASAHIVLADLLTSDPVGIVLIKTERDWLPRPQNQIRGNMHFYLFLNGPSRRDGEFSG
jgi:hypothetical protein